MKKEDKELLEEVGKDLLFYMMQEDAQQDKLNAQGIAYFLNMKLEHNTQHSKEILNNFFDLLERLDNEEKR